MSTANIGRWAVNPAIRASRNGELAAVASREEDRARAFADEWDIPRAHGSYDALLADDEIDAVYIPLPNSLHREWTIRAAEAGKHVLCEKPLALTEAECRDMEEAAAANGVKLMEAFMYRFHPRTDRVLELVRSGTVGDVRMIRSAFTFRLTKPDNIRMDASLGGGALMDVGCYCVNVSRTIAGREPIEAQATATWAESGVDEQLVGTLRFDGGLIAQFDCALTLERREMYEVSGTEGYLTVPNAFLPGTEPAGVQEVRGRDREITHTVEGADEYLLMVEHFSDCVIGDLPPRYSPDEASRNMRVIEALYESARNGGTPVALAPRAARQVPTSAT
ncbi:MAG: Gfo/Idh/MocA family oxidoreductase [Gemmatimonadota bacterium]|nr:Gfo/Idh/MocA family oxidoreductase [Gemmatimonadota bacterium]